MAEVSHPPALTDDLSFALGLADRADEVTLRHFRSADLRVEMKSDLTPVSVADRETEAALREAIAAGRPDDALLGEEYGSEGSSRARWILDPIDATRNYIRGIPIYATLIALERAGELAVAVVSAPALPRRWWAARGQGAFADGEPIGVSRIERLEDASFSFGSAPVFHQRGKGTRLLELASRCVSATGFGDFWQHMLVAEGSLEFALDPVVALWDVAAVQLIVEEAGGRFTDLEGARRADSGSGVSSNGLVHEEVLRALR